MINVNITVTRKNRLDLAKNHAMLIQWGRSDLINYME